jgi:hypothetical protein
MINEQEFNLARGKRKGKAVDAARLSMCFGINQALAADTCGISQQAVSKVSKELGKRISRHEEAFSILYQGIGSSVDIKVAKNAFMRALEGI